MERKLFADIYSHAGRIREYNVTKKEWVLNGATVLYGSATELRAALHISGTFEKIEKPDIGTEKPDIGTEKPDIEETFKPKMANYILRLREAFPGQMVFGRSDVVKVIGIKSSRASELLREMKEQGIIEPVSGYGKGKYRFCQ